ncbi:MAG: hypothetical protein CME59_22585 [Halioglobus sp.]|nr:hypothetical protein [Halioglobus sp.]
MLPAPVKAWASQYAIWLKVAAALCVVVGGAAAGWQARSVLADRELANKDLILATLRASASKAYAESLSGARELEKQREINAQLLDRNRVQREQALRLHSVALSQEVLSYAQADTGRGCGLDPRGVQLHDQAAAGPSGVPEASGGASRSDGPAARAPAARIVAVVTENYTTYHAVAGQLADLQAWVRDVCEVSGRG